MIKSKIHKKKYRSCVGIVLIQNGKIFSGQRLDYKSDAWQMPQGGIEFNENPLDAAIRELEEETGIKHKHIKLISETKKWINYKYFISIIRSSTIKGIPIFSCQSRD